MRRPFKTLRGGPEESYDAVIIGAGIGGLICANLLAREGQRVLLVEQHYMVGGYCSSFRRKGYTFDAATHSYPLLGNPSTITGKLLQDLNITTEWIEIDPVDPVHFPDGSRFSVPREFEAYLSKIKAEFPEESESLDRFFAVVRKVAQLGLLYYFRERDTPQLDPYRDLTVRQMLDRYFHDPKLKLLLAGDSPHWGSPPCRTSFVFDSMLKLSYFLGTYYPRGGSQVFSNEIAQRFDESGGHILLNALIRRIQVTDGRVCGVEIETGPPRRRQLRRVKTDVVISNADMRQTLENMIGADHLDPAYLKHVQSLRPTFPCFLTYIGLKDMSEEVLDEVQGYHWNDLNPDQLGQNGLRFNIFVPTLSDPQMAPPGGHVMIAQKVIDPDHYTGENWASHKALIEQYIMDHLKKIIPGVSEKIVIKESASAFTSNRYTLNTQGAMLGWEMSPEQLGENRIGAVGPIKGLYFTGHWVRPGGGVTPVIISAVQAARAVMEGTTSA
ncbi:MAG: NAD(P)/FAD-dependent oxidoreductase [Gemmatimonadetes bacterium]|jgi:phytoene dehydrogenase-like protein|nr:NAD(P)/FAD-dependent oxidoreductase [Gemmatimonadota bacterium]MBT6146135.1 NAD(P)/FAD-dependent oxidoreductase [Gemmatimonadota bacterium]